MKYTAIILILAASGVLFFCASLFDNSTMIVVVISLGIVCLFGTLPVLLGVITRRTGDSGKSAQGQPDDDSETVKFDSKKD